MKLRLACVAVLVLFHLVAQAATDAEQILQKSITPYQNKIHVNLQSGTQSGSEISSACLFEWLSKLNKLEFTCLVVLEGARVYGELNLSPGEYKHKYIFVNCDFFGRLNFMDTEWERSLEFKQCDFKQGFDFTRIFIKHDLRIEGCNSDAWINIGSGNIQEYAIISDFRIKIVDPRFLSNDKGDGLVADFNNIKVGRSFEISGDGLTGAPVSFTKAKIEGDLAFRDGFQASEMRLSQIYIGERLRFESARGQYVLDNATIRKGLNVTFSPDNGKIWLNLTNSKFLGSSVVSGSSSDVVLSFSNSEFENFACEDRSLSYLKFSDCSFSRFRILGEDFQLSNRKYAISKSYGEAMESLTADSASLAQIALTFKDRQFFALHDEVMSKIRYEESSKTFLEWIAYKVTQYGTDWTWLILTVIVLLLISITLVAASGFARYSAAKAYIPYHAGKNGEGQKIEVSRMKYSVYKSSIVIFAAIDGLIPFMDLGSGWNEFSTDKASTDKVLEVISRNEGAESKWREFATSWFVTIKVLGFIITILLLVFLPSYT